MSVRLSISKGSISPLLHTLRQRGYLLLFILGQHFSDHFIQIKLLLNGCCGASVVAGEHNHLQAHFF